MIQVLYSAIELVPNILGGELDVEHGRVDLGVTHQAHESGK